MLYIKPQAILTPYRLLEDSVVLIEGDRIVALGPASEVHCPPDARQLPGLGHDLLLVPGFIDLQINGAFGCDFTADPASCLDRHRSVLLDGP